MTKSDGGGAEELSDKERRSPRDVGYEGRIHSCVNKEFGRGNGKNGRL